MRQLKASLKQSGSESRTNNSRPNKAATGMLIERFRTGIKAWPEVTHLNVTRTEDRPHQWLRKWAGVWRNPKNTSHRTPFSVQITCNFRTNLMEVLFHGRNEPKMRESFAEWLEQFWGGQPEFLQNNTVRVTYALDSLIKSSGITLRWCPFFLSISETFPLAFYTIVGKIHFSGANAKKTHQPKSSRFCRQSGKRL